MTSSKQRKALRFQVGIVIMVVTVLVLATLLSRRFFEQRTPEMPAGLTPVPPVIPDGDATLFHVIALQGVVEAYQNGQWYLVRPGHLLSAKDVVRTGVGSRAMLRRGGVELELRDNVDVRLDDLEKETAKIGLLRGGRVSARVHANEHLEIVARHTRTANVGAAHFVVSVSPSGKVNVASSEGSVRFSAQDKEVVVASGSESTAMPDEAPSEPEPIPRQLLLSVIWPDDDRLDSQGAIKGRAQPSSRVSVNGVDTEVGADGNFHAQVPLKVGKNYIQVEAEDILGRNKAVDKVVTRAAPAPSLEPTEQEILESMIMTGRMSPLPAALMALAGISAWPAPVHAADSVAADQGTVAAKAGSGGADQGSTQGSADRPRVVLTLVEQSPVIGLTGETVLDITVVNASVPLPMPRVLCSVGKIADLARQGPARFSARYILPSARYPQPAILAAEFPGPGWPIRGMAAVRLRATATPSFHTAPGARVTLRVADREFGPRVADAQGKVLIPIVVPPGVGFAVARSVSQQGSATEQVVDLHVPYAQRVLLVAPERLVAGSVGEVAAYAVDPSGSPASGAELVLRSGRRRVQSLGGEAPGEARFLVSAPTVLRQNSMRVEAQLAGQSTTMVAARIALVPGRAAGLVLEPDGTRLGRGATPLRVYLGAQDSYGNPVPAGHAAVLVDGIPASASADADGLPWISVPTPAEAREAVALEAILGRCPRRPRLARRGSGPAGSQRTTPVPGPAPLLAHAQARSADQLWAPGRRHLLRRWLRLSQLLPTRPGSGRGRRAHRVAVLCDKRGRGQPGRSVHHSSIVSGSPAAHARAYLLRRHRRGGLRGGGGPRAHLRRHHRGLERGRRRRRQRRGRPDLAQGASRARPALPGPLPL